MTSPRALAVLANPGARGGDAPERVRRLLVHRPDVARAVAGVWSVRCAGDARIALREAPADAIVVAAGGDGTANLAAQALLGDVHGRTLAVLPLGTGNAFAHAIGVGRMAAAIAALRLGEDVHIDVMRTTHPSLPVALVSISVGFESALLLALARRRRVSRALGVLCGLPEALRRRRGGVTMRLDGERALGPEEAFYNAGLYAQPCYAFGRRVVPEAQPCDGWGEARVAGAARAYWRSLAGGRALTLRWRAARIESPLPLQADGESIPPGDFDVRVEPGALRVRRPVQCPVS